MRDNTDMSSYAYTMESLYYCMAKKPAVRLARHSVRFSTYLHMSREQLLPHPMQLSHVCI